MLGPALAASIVDQNPTHRLCGGSEEVAAAVPGMPLLTLRALNESNVGFVDQRRRLERLARLFLGQLLRRQLAQLIVDERQELLSAVGVALLDGGQDAGNIIHRGAPEGRSPRRDAPGPGAGFGISDGRVSLTGNQVSHQSFPAAVPRL